MTTRADQRADLEKRLVEAFEARFYLDGQDAEFEMDPRAFHVICARIAAGAIEAMAMALGVCCPTCTCEKCPANQADIPWDAVVDWLDALEENRRERS